MKTISVFILVLLVLAACTAKKIDSIAGNWVINFDETLKSIQASSMWEDLSPEEKELIPETLMETVKYMSMEFSGGKVITHTGNFSTENSYSIKNKTTEQVVLEVLTEDRSVQLTISFLDQGMIRISSDSTTDMDFYIWERQF